MKTPSMRYTDQDLLMILQRLALNHMIVPSQRIIGNDPIAPTHHTYVRRYGSVPEALERAYLKYMEDNMHYHQILISELKRNNTIKTINEFVTVGGVTANAQIITSDGEPFYIDFVGLDGVPQYVIDKHKEIRAIEMADYNYIQLESIADIISEVKRLKEEYQWD